jgi:hypothetical protein
MGNLACPSPYSSPEAAAFCTDNVRFLANRESAEVYWNPKQVANNYAANTPASSKDPGNAAEFNTVAPNSQGNSPFLQSPTSSFQNGPDKFSQQPALKNSGNDLSYDNRSRAGILKGQQQRSIVPQQGSQKLSQQDESQQQFSKVAASEAEFRQLIGSDTDGSLRPAIHD